MYQCRLNDILEIKQLWYCLIYTIDLLHNPTMHRSSIPQCTILQQKCAQVRTFLLQNGAWWDICPMHYGISGMGLFDFLYWSDGIFILKWHQRLVGPVCNLCDVKVSYHHSARKWLSYGHLIFLMGISMLLLISPTSTILMELSLSHRKILEHMKTNDMLISEMVFNALIKGYMQAG